MVLVEVAVAMVLNRFRPVLLPQVPFQVLSQVPSRVLSQVLSQVLSRVLSRMLSRVLSQMQDLAKVSDCQIDRSLEDRGGLFLPLLLV